MIISSQEKDFQLSSAWYSFSIPEDSKVVDFSFDCLNIGVSLKIWFLYRSENLYPQKVVNYFVASSGFIL